MRDEGWWCMWPLAALRKQTGLLNGIGHRHPQESQVTCRLSCIPGSAQASTQWVDVSLVLTCVKDACMAVKEDGHRQRQVDAAKW